VVDLTFNKFVTATFTLRQRTLTVTEAGNGSGNVTSSPAGINCGDGCTTTFTHGTTVTLTADPAYGSTFTGWSGGTCTGTSTCVIDLTSNQSVTATFTLRSWALTVTKDGQGSGTVVSSPAGIDCGADCTGTYTHGTTVTLTASPTGAAVFAGWSGGGCTGTGTCVVDLNGDTSVTAKFVLDQQTLTVTNASEVDGRGDVSSTPVGIECGSTLDCSETYSGGTIVTLVATPDVNSTFIGWSGACSGTGSCVVTMDAATAVTATFVGSPPPF
jgi:hypothetical protein